MFSLGVGGGGELNWDVLSVLLLNAPLFLLPMFLPDLNLKRQVTWRNKSILSSYTRSVQSFILKKIFWTLNALFQFFFVILDCKKTCFNQYYLTKQLFDWHNSKAFWIVHWVLSRFAHRKLFLAFPRPYRRKMFHIAPLLVFCLRSSSDRGATLWIYRRIAPKIKTQLKISTWQKDHMMPDSTAQCQHVAQYLN